MSDVLDYVREREPRFRDVADDELTRYIGERHPQFLQDDRFAKRFELVGEQQAARSEKLPRYVNPFSREPGEPARGMPDMADAETGRASDAPAPKAESFDWLTAPVARVVNPQTVRDAMDMVMAGGELAERGTVGLPLSDEQTIDRLARHVKPGAVSKAIAGIQQAAAATTTPGSAALMLATGGASALSPVLGRVANAGFAGLMAANAGQQAAEVEQAWKNDDTEAFARATAGVGLDALFAGMSAKGALQGIAANNPRIANLLSRRVVQEVPPERIQAVLAKADAGTATPAELGVADLLRGSGLAGDAASGGVTIRGVAPRVGPAFQSWLGVPNARGTVEVRAGERVNPVDRLLLEEGSVGRVQGSEPAGPVGPRPPEAAPAEVRRPREFPEVPGVPTALEGQPYEAETTQDRQASFRKKTDELMRQKADAVNQVVDAAGESGAVELQSQRRPDVRLIVSPEPSEPSKWRVTQVDEHGPVGHHVFEDRSAALKAAAGESFTKQVPGPSYYAVGEFKVARVRPLPSGKENADRPGAAATPAAETGAPRSREAGQLPEAVESQQVKVESAPEGKLKIAEPGQPQLSEAAGTVNKAEERGYYKEPSGKTVIVMPKAEYDALPDALRNKIRSYFNWSPRRKAFISKASKDDFWARQISREAKLEEMDARPAPEQVEQPKSEAEGKAQAAEAKADAALQWKPPASDLEGLARDRADIAAAEQEFKSLQDQYNEVSLEKKRLEDKVLVKSGPKWNRGNYKASAKKSDIEALDALKTALNRIDGAQNVIRENTRGARQRIRIAELGAIAANPNESAVRRAGAAVGALYEAQVDVPAELLTQVETAARQEIRSRVPDVTEEELGRMASALGSEMMNGRKSVDEAFNQNPALNVQAFRRGKLLDALKEITARRPTAELNETPVGKELERYVPGWEATRYGGQAKAGGEPLRASDVARLADMAKAEVSGRVAVEEAERQKAAAASEAARVAEEHETATVRQMMADAADEMAKAGTKRTATEIKKELVERLEAAVRAAPDELGADGAKRRVMIGVPGDGIFALENTKANLREVLKRAKAMSTATGVANTGQARGTPVPSLAKARPAEGDVVKALGEFVHPDRPELNYVFSDGQRALASNGSVVLEVKGKFKPSTAETPFPVEGVATWFSRAETDAGRPFAVSTEDLFRAGRLRIGMEWGDNRTPWVDLFVGNDGKLFAELKDQAGDMAGYGRPTTDNYLGRFNAEQVEDLARFARKMGDGTVSIRAGERLEGKKKLPYALIEGTDWRAVKMRFDREAEVPAPEETKVVETGNAPSTPAPAPAPAPAPPGWAEGLKKGDKVLHDGQVKTVSKAVPGVEFVGIGGRAVRRSELQPVPSTPSGHASAGTFREVAGQAAAPAGAGFASSGVFVEGVEQPLGGMDALNPVLLPEMFRLFQQLTDGETPLLRRYRSANGMFYPVGAGRIGLHPDLFKFPHQLANTFAHEIGHLADYLPDRAMDRGNVLGSIGSLRNWLTTTFPLHPKTSLDEVLRPNDRAKLRREAESQIGPKPADKADAETWRDLVSERYQELVQEEIDARGLVSLKTVRDELLGLTQWWKPYDPDRVPESYRQYRESARELYADALSVLFNSPGHLQQKAPTFYKAFWNWLEKKPDFREALLKIQALISKGDAEVLRARLEETKADFAKGAELFEQAHEEQRRLWSDPKEVFRRLERQLLDAGAELEKIAARERGGGVLPNGLDIREAWEQMKMADNRVFQFSSAIAREVVKPLQDAGLDPGVDLGIYLKHARIAGNKSAREELGLIKARLGKEKYLLAEKFADLMGELERKGVADTHMIDRVILPAEAAGIEFEDIADIDRLRIEQGTRVDLMNPRLVQAKESERTLAQHLADIGPAKAEVLKRAVQAFHDEVFKLVTEGHAVGIFSDRQLQLASANRDTYAAFRPLDYVDTYVQPTMRRAKGTAKAIENPFVTTMLKMQSLADLIMRQRSLNVTRDTMQRIDPEAFKAAETYWTPNGRQAKPAPRDRTRIIVREQGKPVAYDVDPAIGEAYQKLSPYEQHAAARWVNWFFHQTLYKGYVSWSLPFNLWTNPWRDVRRTHLNMAAVFGKRAPSEVDLARAYKDAWADAKKFVDGELTPLSQEAMDFYAIYSPSDSFYSQFPEDDVSHAIMVKLGLAAEPHSRARTVANKIPVLKQALALGDAIQREGQKREAAGKLAPWLALKRAGVAPEQAAAFVRDYAGTPNIKNAGSHSYVPNAIFPFYRIFLQAMRTGARITTNPKTRGGYWFKWATTTGTLRALLVLAGLGYFGNEAKKWADGVPEYDRTRGVPMPVPPVNQIGGDYGVKSVYLRLPDDELSALFGYSLDNAMRAAAGMKAPDKAAQDAAKQWLTSAPGINTYADLAVQGSAYLGGGVPMDNFRNKPVLTEAERKAGGIVALEKMTRFMLDKAGVPFMRQPTSEPETTLENVLRFTPLLKDMVKVSDAGHREQDMAARDAVERVKYAIRQDYGDDTKFLLHRHAQLERAGTTRTLPQEAEWRYLQNWHAAYNRRDAAIVFAQQAGEKGAARERINALEELSSRTKAGMQQRHEERDAAATGERLGPARPDRMTNAVPRRR